MQARKAVHALAWGTKFPALLFYPTHDTPGLVDRISGPGRSFAMEDIVNLFVSNGMSVAIIIYFLYKDYKFNDQIISVLTEMKEVLAALQAWHAKEEG